MAPRTAAAVDEGVDVEAVLRPLPYTLLRDAFGKVLHWSSKGQIRKRHDRCVLEAVHGTPILVLPSVFNPKLLRTGEFFASQINAAVLAAEMDVLDMGTGSGVCAVFAAMHARRVVAVDINPAAVRCAGINALLNHLEHKIDLRHGDLFAPVAGERFDLVLFNPPFVQGTPRDDRDHAWRSTDVAARFASGLRAHLKPGGSALVLLSTFGDAPNFLAEFRDHALDISVLAERRFFNERLAILRLRLSNTDQAT